MLASGYEEPIEQSCSVCKILSYLLVDASKTILPLSRGISSALR